MDLFHKLYPNEKPKLPCNVYSQLLDRMDEETAFEILSGVQKGRASVDDVIRNYIEDEKIVD